MTKPSRMPEYRAARRLITGMPGAVYDKSSIIMADISEVDAFLQAAQADVVAAIRPAAQAGAQVIYDRVRLNASRIGGETGSLSRSIYQVYSKMQSNPYRNAMYHISWNRKKAPHGHLIEYGHVRPYHFILNHKTGEWVTIKRQKLTLPVVVPPRSFLRTAISSYPTAIAAAKQEFYNKLTQFK